MMPRRFAASRRRARSILRSRFDPARGAARGPQAEGRCVGHRESAGDRHRAGRAAGDPERRRRSREHPQERDAPPRDAGQARADGEVLETAGNPLVWGELKVPGATRTLLLYAHYDGQPVEPPRTGSSRRRSRRSCAPAGWRMAAREVADLATRTTFEADQRIYARSASDDKSPIVAVSRRSTRSRRAACSLPRTSASCSTAKRRPDRRAWCRRSRSIATSSPPT